jgi:hypothetical protein
MIWAHGGLRLANGPVPLPNLLCLVLVSLPRKALNLFSQKITTFLKILSKIC